MALTSVLYQERPGHLQLQFWSQAGQLVVGGLVTRTRHKVAVCIADAGIAVIRGRWQQRKLQLGQQSSQLLVQRRQPGALATAFFERHGG